MGCNPSVMVAPLQRCEGDIGSPQDETLRGTHDKSPLGNEVEIISRLGTHSQQGSVADTSSSKSPSSDNEDHHTLEPTHIGNEPHVKDGRAATKQVHAHLAALHEDALLENDIIKEEPSNDEARVPRPIKSVTTQSEDAPNSLSKAKTSASPSKRRMRWKKGELIGAGSYGKVFVGLNELSGSLMAVKEVRASSEAEVRALQQEVGLMRSLRHENIVQYLGSEADAKLRIVSIFTEWVPGGSIAGLLQKFGGLTESVVRKYTRQILQGLAYLHRKGVIHRDIKGANILVDDRGCIKLADFGASKVLSGAAGGSILENHSLRGTPYFMAPEVITQTGHGRKADIWSVGCTTLQMVSGKPPWKSMQFGSLQALMYHICNTNEAPPMPHDISSALRSFLMICFQRLPAERPTANSLLQHPFLSHVPADDQVSVGSLTEREVEERPTSSRSFSKSKSTFLRVDATNSQVAQSDHAQGLHFETSLLRSDHHETPLHHDPRLVRHASGLDALQQTSSFAHVTKRPGSFSQPSLHDNLSLHWHNKADEAAVEKSEDGSNNNNNNNNSNNNNNNNSNDSGNNNNSNSNDDYKRNYNDGNDGNDGSNGNNVNEPSMSEGTTEDNMLSHAGLRGPEDLEKSFMSTARRVDELEVSSYVRDRVLQSQKKRDEWENTIIETVESQKIRDNLRRAEMDSYRKKQAEKERWQREMQEELEFQRRTGLRR